MRNASPSEAAKLRQRYRIWLRQGENAGDWAAIAGAALVALPIVLTVALWPIGSPLIWAGLAAGPVAGLLCFRVAARQERAWRRGHPFRPRGGPPDRL